MNRKILFLIFIILGSFTLSHAQDDRIHLKGTILDEKTNEPIAFANMGLLGTVAGTATDMDGNFELIVPLRYATHIVKITAVGYASKEIKVYDLQENPNSKIRLSPVTYGISQVDVIAESLVYKRLIENIVNNIGRNYIPRAYNYEGYFQYGLIINDGDKKSKEAIVNIYDSEGYKRSNTEKTFSDINYTLTQVRREGTDAITAGGMVYLDDILSADIVRNTRNVLDLQYFNDFKFKSKGKFLFEGDSVEILSYECTKPNISNTGDTYTTKYSGELYVDLKNYAVIRNVLHLTSSGFNLLGRNILLTNDVPKNGVDYTIITSYKKVSSFYFLSGVSVAYNLTNGGTKVRGEIQYQTTKLKVNSPEPIQGRLYFEDIPTDYAFWDRYTIYLEEE